LRRRRVKAGGEGGTKKKRKNYKRKSRGGKLIKRGKGKESGAFFPKQKGGGVRGWRSI